MTDIIKKIKTSSGNLQIEPIQATTEQLGGVKIDGSTITMNDNGVISSSVGTLTYVGDFKSDAKESDPYETETISRNDWGDTILSYKLTAPSKGVWFVFAATQVVSTNGLSYGFHQLQIAATYRNIINQIFLNNLSSGQTVSLSACGVTYIEEPNTEIYINYSSAFPSTIKLISFYAVKLGE